MELLEDFLIAEDQFAFGGSEVLHVVADDSCLPEDEIMFRDLLLLDRVEFVLVGGRECDLVTRVGLSVFDDQLERIE